MPGRDSLHGVGLSRWVFGDTDLPGARRGEGRVATRDPRAPQPGAR